MLETLKTFSNAIIEKVKTFKGDWNVNDPTDPAYVKNRPFYTGDPVETVLVEESTVSFSFSEREGVYLAQNPTAFSATVGEIYKVYWDGSAYECTCVAISESPLLFIGNLSIMGAGSDTGEPFLIGVFNGEGISISTTDTSASHTISISGFVQEVVKIDEKYLPDTVATTEYVDNSVSNPLNITSATVGQIAKISTVDDTGKPTAWEAVNMHTPFKPEGKSYLTFSSPNSFTLAVGNATKHWDGTLEYFASNKTWTTWDGTTTLSSVENDGEHVLYLRGTGNTVITGNKSNYRWLLTGSDIKCIGNIENLLDYATIEAGNHPTMANYCYNQMFFGCTSLTHAPDLPTTTLANSCYAYMFKGCTSLTQAPALPATTLANQCYSSMFQDCTTLTQPPALPATTLANQCYSYMFRGCTALIQVPELPATTLANYCYYYMFQGCTSLTQAPALQATTLADYCYEYMFADCTSLTQAPALPATTLAFRCYYNMFSGCTSLKLSATQTGEYIQEYRIPTTGTGTTANSALTNMFTNTGGNFLGAPSINTTYYLSTDNMIVRDTEVATLNGYVGSMIDAAIGNAIGGSY